MQPLETAVEKYLWCEKIIMTDEVGGKAGCKEIGIVGSQFFETGLLHVHIYMYICVYIYVHLEGYTPKYLKLFSCSDGIMCTLSFFLLFF